MTITIKAPSPGQSWECAQLLKQRAQAPHGPRYSRWNLSWVEFVGTHWNFVDQEDVIDWAYTETANWTYDAGNATHKWAPNRKKIGDLLHAYGPVAKIQNHFKDGQWLDGSHAGEQFIPMRNGLLNIRTRELIPSSHEYFTTWSLPYDYDGDALEPAQWLKFLNSTLPDRQDDIDTLQEWMGYLVSGRTDMHKAMLLTGIRRSGKSTIQGICEQLVGQENVGATSFSTLGESFGLETLLGKSLITIGDSQTDRPNKTAIERVKSITGGDTVGINRKHQKEMSVKLPGRLMVATNLGVSLHDASGAAASRFLHITFAKSFEQNPDLQLSNKLAQELPQIMKWALDGLDRLTRNGKFTESIDAKQEKAEMMKEGSPVTIFLEETCNYGPDFVVPRKVLYEAYKIWAKQNGYRSANSASLGRSLKVCGVPHSEYRPLSESGKQVWCYRGFQLTDEALNELEYVNDMPQEIRKLSKEFTNVRSG